MGSAQVEGIEGKSNVSRETEEVTGVRIGRRETTVYVECPKSKRRAETKEKTNRTRGTN